RVRVYGQRVVGCVEVGESQPDAPVGAQNIARYYFRWLNNGAGHLCAFVRRSTGDGALVRIGHQGVYAVGSAFDYIDYGSRAVVVYLCAGGYGQEICRAQ